MNERHWFVHSGVMYETEVVIEETGEGPIIDWRETVSVIAATRREAKVKGMRLMKAWPEYARCDGMNPFAGITVGDAACKHGWCWCDHVENGDVTRHPDQDDYCDECAKENGDE